MFQIIVYNLINITMVQAWCLLKLNFWISIMIYLWSDVKMLCPDCSWWFLTVPDGSWLFLIVPDRSCPFLIIPGSDQDWGSYQVVQSLSRAVTQGRLKMAVIEVK